MSVILISLDCVRPDKFYTLASTPNLDVFREDRGARYVKAKDAYCCATCTPGSHATMLTGRFPPGHGLRKMYGQSLPIGVPMIQEEFKAAGYMTKAFVNAHTLANTYGLHRGFDSYQLVNWRNAESEKRLVSMLKSSATGRPYFILLHLFSAHAHWRGSNTLREHVNGIELMDEVLGPVFDLADDDVTVVVTSDHGDDFGEMEVDHGRELYDATTKVVYETFFDEGLPDSFIEKYRTLYEERMVQHTDIVPMFRDLLQVRETGTFREEDPVPFPNVAYCEAPKTGKYSVRFSDGESYVFLKGGELDQIITGQDKTPKSRHVEAIGIADAIRASTVEAGMMADDPAIMKTLMELGYV